MKQLIEGERFCLTGSSQYDLPDYVAKDTDICIFCEDQTFAYKRIMAKIYDMGGRLKREVEYCNDYSLPFSWGGITFGRFQVGDYDIFLVDRETYEAIVLTTEAMKKQPMETKVLMARYKDFRVEMFQMIAQQMTDHRKKVSRLFWRK